MILFRVCACVISSVFFLTAMTKYIIKMHDILQLHLYSIDVISLRMRLLCVMKSKPKINFHYEDFTDSFCWFHCLGVNVQLNRKIAIVRKRINHYKMRRCIAFYMLHRNYFSNAHGKLHSKSHKTAMPFHHFTCRCDVKSNNNLVTRTQRCVYKIFTNGSFVCFSLSLQDIDNL